MAQSQTDPDADPPTGTTHVRIRKATKRRLEGHKMDGESWTDLWARVADEVGAPSGPRSP